MYSSLCVCACVCVLDLRIQPWNSIMHIQEAFIPLFFFSFPFCLGRSHLSAHHIDATLMLFQRHPGVNLHLFPSIDILAQFCHCCSAPIRIRNALQSWFPAIKYNMSLYIFRAGCAPGAIVISPNIIHSIWWALSFQLSVMGRRFWNTVYLLAATAFSP